MIHIAAWRGRTIRSLFAMALVAAASFLPVATPHAAAATLLSLDFSSVIAWPDGQPVPYTTGVDMTWSDWCNQPCGWIGRTDTSNSNHGVFPYESGSHGVQYAYFEQAAYNADQTPSNGFLVNTFTIVNQDSTDNEFLFWCGDQQPADIIISAHSAHQYNGTDYFTQACNATARPLGYIGLAPLTGNLNTIGLQAVSFNWDDSWNIPLGTRLGTDTNNPQAIQVPTNYPVFEPFVAQGTGPVNSFAIYLWNAQPTGGTDVRAYYELSIWDATNSGNPGNALSAYCTLEVDYSTTAGWHYCTAGPPSSPLNLTIGQQYYLNILDTTSHAAEYDTYLAGEDWATNENNGLVGTSKTSWVNGKNPAIQTNPYVDVGRHPAFYTYYATPNILLGTNYAGTSPQHGITLSGNLSWPVNGINGTNIAAAEQFTAWGSGIVGHLVFYEDSNPNYNPIWAAILSDNNGSVGTQLAACPAGHGTGTWQWDTCPLNTTVNLTYGVNYWLVVEAPYNNSSNYYRGAACAVEGTTVCANHYASRGMQFYYWGTNGMSHPAWGSPQPNVGGLMVYTAP